MPGVGRYSSLPRNRALQICAVALLSGSMWFAVGCGGSNSASNPVLPGSSPTQVKIGDAPADRVVSFEVSVGPITLTPTSGAAVTVLSRARRIELTHLSGANEPLALLHVPQGSYSSAALTVSNPEVTFINSQGRLVELQPAFNQMITVNFNPLLTVGAHASVINIDLNLANSVTFDAQGNVTGVSLSAASFTISTSAVAAEKEQEAEDGELEDLTGMVTNVSGSSFTMSAGQNGPSLTFTTDANTEFNDGASLATMMSTIVTVEGVTRADGTLHAKEVEGIENENGVEVDGVITQVTGNPATQLTIVSDDGMGSGMDATKLGTTLTVNVSGAQYRVHKGNIDTSGIGGLPSAPNFSFDATTIHSGQRVEVESVSSLSGASITVEKVKLQQQAVTGTVSGLSGSAPTTFTLTLPSDSAFAMLAGSTTITVFLQPGTGLHNLSSGFKNGDTVRVRGLVFFTGSGFNMIARRIG